MKTIGVYIGIALVLLATTVFLFYTYFKVKNTKSPISTNSATVSGPQAPTDAAMYSNAKYSYSFNCPPNTVYSINESKGDGIEAPFVHEACTDLGNTKKSVDIFVWSAKAEEVSFPSSVSVKKFDSKSGNEQIYIASTVKAYFDQVVASFKITK